MGNTFGSLRLRRLAGWSRPLSTVLGTVAVCGLLFSSAAFAQAVITRVSVGPGGVQADSVSYYSDISGDGRYVAFDSLASNLVAGDTNATLDVFVHDRLTNTTTRVSVGPGGAQANDASRSPAISADGRFVAFQSSASNLVAGDTNGTSDVFVHDRVMGTTTRVSVGPGGVEGNNASEWPTISADGGFVAFGSYANNLVAGDTNGTSDIFVHDRATGATTRVSVRTGGVQSNGVSELSTISGDGRFVAFDSLANNLVAADTNGSWDVFVHDRVTNTTTRVSVGPGGMEGNAVSRGPILNADGSLVAFLSYASNLVASDTNGVGDVFLHDRSSGTTTRVSVSSGGGQSNGGNGAPDLSADGRFVAFESTASNLVLGDTTDSTDVFVYDRVSGTTRRVSVGPGWVHGNGGESFAPAVNADATVVAFYSSASNLVDGDRNGVADVFVNQKTAAPRDVTSWKRWNIDADERTDMAVWRPGSGTWYTRLSSSLTGQYLERTWGGGWENDQPVPGDYDGDGMSDFAVWRPGNGYWYILTSSSGYATSRAITWGGGWAGDLPVPADYDGDGRTDIAVWRPSTGIWYVKTSTSEFSNYFTVQWGLGSASDRPVVGDYDGDGRADIAVWRADTGTWYVLRSQTDYSHATAFIRQWGLGSAGDQPVVGDYDGDGRADLAVWRGPTGVWYLMPSSGGYSYDTQRAVQWGGEWAGDAPLAGDYDGDGRTDIAVWRGPQGLWYVKRSSTDFADSFVVQWGGSWVGDRPVSK